MTAKEKLLEYVSSLDEQDAAEALVVLAPPDIRALSPAEIALIRRGLDDLRTGRKVSTEEIEREFGLRA